MNTSLPWKVSVPLSPGQPYEQTSHGSAVAKLIGLHPLHISFSGNNILWSATEQEALLAILQKEDNSFQPDDPLLILRRVAWRMRVNGVYNFDAYKQLLINNLAEMPALRKSLSMRVTEFFKDPTFFVALEKVVFPRLIHDASPAGIHALITHCGTGEEAYSIAILLEYLKKEYRIAAPLRIIACDQDEQTLKQASAGYYPHLLTADLSPLCLNMFFNATTEGYKIGNELQTVVHFEPEHTENPSIHSTIDLLVSTQPLLFQSDDVRNKLIQAFYNKIRPGGFLVLNPLSHSDHVLSLFKEVDLQLGIYERKASPPADKKVLIPQQKKENVLTDTIEDLENELVATKEQLSSTINDYVSSHDELVDINHDLQSSVDHLILERDQIDAERTSLQKMVGNIMKANKELKNQNNRINAANHQWEDIISLCGIGILLVDAQLCITMFTSDVAQLFSLKKHDIGRPLSHLQSPFQFNLSEAATSVVHARTVIEKELSCKSGQWFQLRISPWIKQDTVEGIVLSFFDITETKRKNEWNRFRANILNQFEDAVIVTNRSGQVTYVNQAAIHRFGLYHRKRTGYSIEELYQSVCNTQEDTDIIEEILEEKGSWSGELYYQSTEGKSRRAQTTIMKLKDEAGQPIGYLNIIRDSFRIQLQDNSSLQRIIEDLTERNESLSDFYDSGQ